MTTTNAPVRANSTAVEPSGIELDPYPIPAIADDEVFGRITGTCGTYVVCQSKQVCKKPRSLSFADAAALPHSSLAALQGLRKHGGIATGQKVLITEACTGIGMAAIQIAKAFRAEVTAVCDSDQANYAKTLGADHIIDPN